MNIRERIDQLSHQNPGLHRLILIFVPILMGLALIPILRLMYEGEKYLQILGLMFFYFIPPAGKETIIPAAIELGFPWQIICILLIYIDLVLCLFMLWNFDLICRIPLIGRWIYYLVQNGSDYLSKHHWVERFCFIGLVSFVFVPLQGSGSIGGSILGRILGMNQLSIFIAVFVGTTLQSILIGVSMYAIQQYFDLNLWFFVIPVLLLVLVTSTISLIYYLMKKRTEADTPG